MYDDILGPPEKPKKTHCKDEQCKKEGKYNCVNCRKNYGLTNCVNSIWKVRKKETPDVR